jgi:hypothetical protein
MRRRRYYVMARSHGTHTNLYLAIIQAQNTTKTTISNRA